MSLRAFNTLSPHSSSDTLSLIRLVPTLRRSLVAPIHGIDSWQSTNPATTGCPLAARDCRTPQPCKPRGEWRAIRMGDASSLALSLSKGRVGTGDETPLPRRRQSDEKVPSPFPGKTLGTRPRSGCLRLGVRAEPLRKTEPREVFLLSVQDVDSNP